MARRPGRSETKQRRFAKEFESPDLVRKFAGHTFRWRNHEKLKSDAQRQATNAKEGIWKQARVRKSPSGGYDVFVRGKKR